MTTCLITYLTDFNSIKVRLNQDNRFLKDNQFNTFQFHKGTIKPAIRKQWTRFSQISIP